MAHRFPYPFNAKPPSDDEAARALQADFRYAAGSLDALSAADAVLQASIDSLASTVAGLSSGSVSKDFVLNEIEFAGDELRVDMAGQVLSDANISATAEVQVSKLADGNAFDVLVTNADGSTVGWQSGILDANVNAGAAIGYSKLNLASSVKSSDLSPSGAIPDKDYVEAEIEAACNDVRKDMNANRSLALFGACAVFSPADVTNYFFGGCIAAAPQTAGGSRILNVPCAGTIKASVVNWLASGVAGTGQTVSLYIRKNNTTDYLIESIADTNAIKVFDNYALDIPVAPGDYIEWKVVSPTWTTNPTNVTIDAHVYIENNPTYP